MLVGSSAQYRVRLPLLVRRVLLLMLLLPILNLGVYAAPADTEVGGPIISDTTWTLASSPYIVVESVEVWEGVTLTIEPGVTVKFNSEKKLQVNGELIAQGMASSLITFTSNQASPAPGDWGNIEFTSTAITTTMDAEGNYVSGSILQYCVVEYAGANAYSAIQAHSLLIDHCTVRNNDARGIGAGGIETAPSRITNNTVSGNVSSTSKGGGICASNSTVSDNIVHGNLASGCGGGVFAGPGTVVSGNTVSGNSIAGYDAFGGGICVYAYQNSSGDIATVSGNKISGNSVSGRSDYAAGAGIYVYFEKGRVTVSDNTISDNTISGTGYAFGYGGGVCADTRIGIVTVSDNTVSGNSVYSARGGWGGGISVGHLFLQTASNESTFIVSGNAVISNSAPLGGGVSIGDSYWVHGQYKEATVSGNIVSRNSARIGGGIYARGNCAVFTNTITVNSVSGGYDAPRGAGAYLGGSGAFLYNTMVSNSGPAGSIVGGVEIYGTPQVHYNNFYSNEPYDVTILSSGDISGTHNYWGTVSSVDILEQVHDWYDDSSLGKFLYIPYLQEPSEDAPFPPPTGLTADFPDESAELSWDAHPSFTTGYGYKVYYDTDSSIPPYEGTGLNEGDSPIDVGDQTTYTLTGLDPSKDYYLTVTAYDNEGHESWYSNVEWRQGGYWAYLPVVLKNH